MLKLLQTILVYLTGNLTVKLDEVLLAQKEVKIRLAKIEEAINGEPPPSQEEVDDLANELKEQTDKLESIDKPKP